MTTINAYRFKELTFGNDKYILVEHHGPSWASWRKIFPRTEKRSKICKELSDLNNKICDLEQELNDAKMSHSCGTDEVLIVEQIDSMKRTINILLKRMTHWQDSFSQEELE